ncbi:sirohydrochlorin cobaltochelatase [Desulforhopalus singaporensis]|nr:sirohydrochlorin cobaltochelatase [Desulforhopalus singaporensis]
MRLPQLKEKPAIIIATFGSSNRGGAALEIFRDKLQEVFGDYEHFWAYTSEIIRKKKGLPSLQEILAKVEANGYRKAIIQPLHIFPGTEYQQLIETSYYFPGLRTIVSETLCHRWHFVRQILDVVAGEFLPPDKGLNLLALHGTPLVADPVNSAYLGLERTAIDLYPNVLVASIDGVPDHESVFNRIDTLQLNRKYPRIKIIPVMYFAGLHVKKDLMGETGSWRETLENQGFTVECPEVSYRDERYFKGLAFYPECIDFFAERISRSLTLAAYY